MDSTRKQTIRLECALKIKQIIQKMYPNKHIFNRENLTIQSPMGSMIPFVIEKTIFDQIKSYPEYFELVDETNETCI